MTKPTQQQIEAAAKAIFDFDSRNSRAPRDYSKLFYEQIAKAALTAAAEAGEQCGCGYDNPDDVCMVHAPIVERHVAAEREACAQVAEDFAYVETCADDTARGTTNAAPYRKVAAAIRARKD